MASIKRRGNVIRVQLRPEERGILAGLAREVAQLLGGKAAPDPDPLAVMVGLSEESTQPPDDPAVRRLLPDAYDDPAGAAEFRRLTDAELRQGKATALLDLVEEVESRTGALELSPDRADGWLSAINDVRLVLGVRIGIDDDAGVWRDRLDPDDPRLPLLAAYDWLSMLQEMLVDALL